LRVCDIPSWQKGIGEFYPTLKKEKKLDKDDKSSDQPGGKYRIVVSTSNSKPGSTSASGSQPGCSSSSSDVGSQMECETAIGGSDADEREQNQGCDEKIIANKNAVQNGNKESIREQGSSEEGTSDTNAELKKEKKLDKDDESSDQPEEKGHIVASTSGSQPGSSTLSSDIGCQMECETTIGGSDADEREQSQRCDEESVESKNPEKNGNKEDINEQGTSMDSISDTNAEPKAGSSGSFSDDEQPGCSR